MAHIVPFRALRYNPQRVWLPQVVTQPYDKITPGMQKDYYAASPHNLVRIVLGMQEPGDNQQQNVYTRAAAYYRDWRSQGVFIQESEPYFYLYAQKFALAGGEYERRGLIALGRVEDYSAGVVFRHEQTLAKPKADRLELLRATRAHFEQLFMLYADPGGEMDNLLSAASDPEIEVRDEYDVLHRLWKISEPARIAHIQDKMRERKLIIADGHHRYETALNYREERRAAAAAPADSGTAPAPYDLVMMTLVSMDSPGLIILPTHRVVHGLESFSSADMQTRLRAYFEIEDIDPSLDAERAVSILHEAGHAGTALLAVTAEIALLLHSPKNSDPAVLAGLSARQQALDVVQLHKCVLEGVLGLSPDSIRNQQNIRYLRDAGEALQQVRTGRANVAFLMNPARIDQVRDIAFGGEVLPQKSTDFYPKLLSGLTIYALE